MNEMDLDENEKKLHFLWDAISKPHVDSFNYFLTEGLPLCVKSLQPEIIPATFQQSPSGETILTPECTIWLSDVHISKPTKTTGEADTRLFPYECRELGLTYNASIEGSFCWSVSSHISDQQQKYQSIHTINNYNQCHVKLGSIPIMVRSKNCHLSQLNSTQLISRKEESNEFGGYFICSGKERMIRLLILPRRNHVFAFERSTFMTKGSLFTKYATSVRSVNSCHKSHTIVLHYLADHSCLVRFSIRREEFFVPVIDMLKALIQTTDKEIYEKVIGHEVDLNVNKNSETANTNFLADCIEFMLRLNVSERRGTSRKENADLQSSDIKKKSKLKERENEDHDEFSDSNNNNTISRSSLPNIINTTHKNIHEDIIASLGSKFRVVLDPPVFFSDYQVGKHLLDEYILIHCSNNREKFNLLIFMIQRLFSLVQGFTRPDNIDSLSSSEILLPGHFCCMFFNEKLQEWLRGIRQLVSKELNLQQSQSQNININNIDDRTSTPPSGRVSRNKDRYKDICHPRDHGEFTESYFRSIITRQKDCVGKFEYFLRTGNLLSSSGLELMQKTGFVIIADKLNIFRFIAHFRSVHRGSFFQEHKISSVRQLLPEAWGFICPVHTPDGAPCGLLNHLTLPCTIVTHHCTDSNMKKLKNYLRELGMFCIEDNPAMIIKLTHQIPILLNAVIIGVVSCNIARQFVHQLRTRIKLHNSYTQMKTTTNNIILPNFATIETLEIVPVLDDDGLFSAIYLSTSLARLVRPVINLEMSKSDKNIIEWIGPMEQMFLNINIESTNNNKYTHQELSPGSILSLNAAFVPFSDHNQSPRNMYQCQMGKQSMGISFHSFCHRTDQRIYRLNSIQQPLARTKEFNNFHLEDYSIGTNAVVAVLSYTGYDMEDAMILNKASYNRGLFHASMFENRDINIGEKLSGSSNSSLRFDNHSTYETNHTNTNHTSYTMNTDLNLKHTPDLPLDGIPEIGQKIPPGGHLYCTRDQSTNRMRIQHNSSEESCFVDTVRLLGCPETSKRDLQHINIRLRVPRNPTIGDKFSSRHGQKGILSVLWPQEDMPFTNNGIIPDIIINPHAFPSRMTIGMLIECMSAKSGALHGYFPDATPFVYNDKNPAFKHFGNDLIKAGYNYYGNETMYSGITGCQFHADIFIGIVYYQRLRQMVSDKAQVRATGPVSALTRQPVKGKRRHGGIRFGEMERDALLAHGASSLLQDRLLYNSDYSIGYVCKTCGSVITPTAIKRDYSDNNSNNMNMTAGLGIGMAPSQSNAQRICSICKTDSTYPVSFPFVFLYLVYELAAMSVRVGLDLK